MGLNGPACQSPTETADKRVGLCRVITTVSPQKLISTKTHKTQTTLSEDTPKKQVVFGAGTQINKRQCVCSEQVPPTRVGWG